MAAEMNRVIQAEYARRRQQDIEEEDRRRQAAVTACPEIGRLMQARQDMVFAGIRGILQGSAAENLPEQMAALNARIRTLLTEHGFDGDWLEPVYVCPKCRDTGFVGEPLQRECSCRKALKSRLLAGAAGLAVGEQTFERFDPGVFPDDEPIPGRGWTQRQSMVMVREQLERWADQCPQVPDRTVVLSGKSGLGKTYLLRCVADRLVQRGIPCLLTTAYQVLEAARKATFSDDARSWEEIMETEILLMDDLGSEPLYQNVTVEQIYQLIDQRQQRGKLTMISTNLSRDELQKRYTERVASRLLDRRQSDFIQLEGVDVRRRG